MEDFTLNEEQKLPVEDTEGAVLVLAGAGSGKTRVLTARIAHLVEDLGVAPSNILAITFTNKAAGEMRDRLFSATDMSGMWVCTIHSMCVKILRAFAPKRGLSANFSIYGEQERTAVLKQAFKECGFDEDELFKAVKWHVSNAKMQGLSPEEYLRENINSNNIKEITTVYQKYVGHLKVNNALDFDDLLIETKELLRTDDEARAFFAGKFRYIHVDEFQDTNALQFEIIKLLSSVHKNLFVVGDDDQSIYGWRGAEIENILHFERAFPKAKVYKLQQNYRSTKYILDLANASINNNSLRKQKRLWTERGEGEKPTFFEAEEEAGEALFCARKVKEMLSRGKKYGDFAILMRVNALTRSFEQEFTKYQIPYKVFGGFKFYERKEIKDTLAYLRLISNPFDDEAFLRIINVPRRGIGDRTIVALQTFATEREMSLLEASFSAREVDINEGAKQKLLNFSSMIKTFAAYSLEESVDKFVRRLLKESGMYESYLDGTDEGYTKRENLDELINSVEEFVRLNEGATLTDYLQQITLYSDTDEMTDGDYVTIATIHAVKGLEFDTVFLVGLEEGLMPTSRSIGTPKALEEERRLMYVAITRAKENLFLSLSKSRFLYGRRERTMPSRFLEELKGMLGIPERAPRGRDFSLGRGGYSGYGGGFGGGYNYGGGAYAPKRVGSAREFEEKKRLEALKRNSPAPIKSAPKKEELGARADLSRLEVGVRVRHPRFGDGVITATRGNIQNLIVTVKFDAAGNKDLAAVLAPLEILGE